MKEKGNDKELCGECGVEIRRRSLFCYNCASPVTEDSHRKSIEILKKESSRENPSGKNIDRAKQSAARRGIRNSAKRRPVEKGKAKKTIAPRYRSLNTVWEATSDSPNLSFIVSAIVVAFAAGILFLIAMYYK